MNIKNLVSFIDLEHLFVVFCSQNVINFSVSNQQDFAINRNFGSYDVIRHIIDVTCQLNYINLISL